MKLANELENLVARITSESVVEEMSNVELHWRALFRCDSGSLGRITLVVGILEHGELTLIEMHRGFLAFVNVDDLSHLLARSFTPQQESTASFEESTEVVDVGTGKVVEENLEDVEDNVNWRNSEFGEFSEEAHIL